MSQGEDPNAPPSNDRQNFVAIVEKTAQPMWMWVDVFVTFSYRAIAYSDGFRLSLLVKFLVVRLC